MDDHHYQQKEGNDYCNICSLFRSNEIHIRVRRPSLPHNGHEYVLTDDELDEIITAERARIKTVLQSYFNKHGLAKSSNAHNILALLTPPPHDHEPRAGHTPNSIGFTGLIPGVNDQPHE